MVSEEWTLEKIMEEVDKEYYAIPLNLKNIMDIFSDHLKLEDTLKSLNKDELKYLQLHLENTKNIRENTLTHTIDNDKIKANRKIMTKLFKMFSGQTKMLMCWLFENKDKIKITDFSIELL